VLRVLIAVDGSENAERAVDYAIALARGGQPLELHILNVQISVASGHAKLFLSEDQLNAYYRDEGLAALRGARQKLDAAQVPYRHHIGVGHVAETIAEYVKQHRCDQVVMGTRGMSGIGNLVLGSIANQVIHLTNVPVTLVK
jgi:nucleotide-binding universal stress UspA family protein